MSNKILIVLIIVLAITIPTIFFAEEPKPMSREKLTDWIRMGYSQQFCRVIFPHVTTCVTLKPDECFNLAQTTIDNCLSDLSLKDSYHRKEAYEVYKNIGTCFQQNMHDTFMQKYLIPSEECWKKML